MELLLQNISKKYGSFEALKDFSYEFTPGIYGLLGPNGAGKSTLMNIISGVLQQTSGKVLWNEKNISELGKDYGKELGFLPQTSGYYKNFTATEFLEYVAMLKGYTDKKVMREEINRLLSEVNLTEVENKKMNGFSGGMRQRVGIAQALLGNPKLLIFDEPTAGLDPKERIRFRNIISELALDRIIILATHIVSDIEMTANNILIVKRGELIQSGSIEMCTKPLKGKVFTMEMSQKDFGIFAISHKVVSVFRSSSDIVKIRFISDKEILDGAIETEPSLEDVYMYYFGDE